MRRIIILIAGIITFGTGFTPPVRAQEVAGRTTTTQDVDRDRTSNVGWIGLVGLAGLLGLTRKQSNDSNVPHRDR